MDAVVDKKPLVRFIPMNYDMWKIKPDSTLSGTFYDNIIDAIHSTRSEFISMFEQEPLGKYNAMVKVNFTHPVTYEIMFDGNDKKNTPLICFGVPETKSQYMKQRIQAILPNSTLTLEKDYIDDFQNCYMCEYNYEKDSMLSLKIKDNNFLQALLNIKNEIQSDEKILFQVEMLPISDMWKSFQDEKWDKVRNGNNVTIKRGLFDKSIDFIHKNVEDIVGLMDEIVEYKDSSKKSEGKSSSDKKEKPSKISEYSSASKTTKKSCDGFSVRIKAYIVASEEAAKTYATTLEVCMMELEEDNRLIKGRLKKNKSLARGKFINPLSSMSANIMSSKELASIVNIPNQKLQRQFKINSVNTKEVNAPKQMLKGKVLLGNLTKHGQTVGVYLSEDRDLTCLPLFILTKMGGGKTTFMLNLCNDAIKNKHGLVLFDYIKNCATANALLKMHPNCKKITFDDWNKLCTFAFPEVEVNEKDEPFKRRLSANILAIEVKYLLNSMASDTENMSRIMSEYLTASCKVVFINEKQTLQNVYLVLTDEETRGEYIEKATREGVFTDKSFEVKKLRELDDNPNAAKGVLDRFSVINEDTLFQEMMLKPYDSNVNFVDIMNESEPVVIMMPQDIFTSKLHKDAICTYFMSRVRLAMSRRKNFDNIAHVVVDELHQIPNTMNLVADTIAEPRKFSMQYVMSLHAMSQIENKSVREKIMGVGCNFMLLKGISAQAFDEFKPILNGEWEYEDLINMDYKFGSLNAFMVENAYRTFITEMPPALKDNKGNLYIA